MSPALPREIEQFAIAFGVDPGTLKRFRSKGVRSTEVLMVFCTDETPDFLWCLGCDHREPLIPEDYGTGEYEAGPAKMEKHLRKVHNSKPDYYMTSPDEIEQTLDHIAKTKLWREERMNFGFE